MKRGNDFSPRQVIVRDSLNKAIQKLNKLCAEDGVFKKLKEKRAYEKPSQRKRRKKLMMVKDK